MARKLFGTDGIRGVAGEPPLDIRTAHALGIALGKWVRSSAGGETEDLAEVILGMDTRESGPWLVEQIAGGLKNQGVEARFAGVITTPGVAYLARTGPFAAGVMVSASHNPYLDNGIKVIDHAGYKLADALEEQLEADMFEWLNGSDEPVAAPVPRDASLDNFYSDYLASTVEGKLPYRLVIDCANGSATAVAPELFERLGARITLIGDKPNGRNINLNCGSLHLEQLRERVMETGADAGVAFDGDADRALFVSHEGKTVDGDAILYIAGTALKQAAKLPGDVVVATVMSNLGLQRALAGHDISLVRTPVGDKYVLEEMLKRGAALGGEQSGHVIFSEYATTGDGILTALRVFEIMRNSGCTLGELASAVRTFPQKLVNIRVKHKRPLHELDEVQGQIRAAEMELQSSGRVLVRFSGTEPLARVMVEAETEEQVEKWTSRIAHAIRQQLGATE
ncbi:MAG TPA: phosphoglucosamine mutase [Bryobacteraceae bacterium]